MAGKKSVLSTLKNFTTGLGEILDRVLEGETLDNTKNASAAFAFKDSDGKAVFPSLNPDGTIPTSPDTGTPFVGSTIKALGTQTIDTREEYLSVVLDVDAVKILKYTKPDFKVTSYAEALVEIELIVDKGLGGEAITALGYGATNDMHINDRQRITNNNFEVPAAATTAALRLMVTPFEDGNQGDDIRLTASCNKLA